MSETSKEGYYQSCSYYWLIFTGKFCQPKNSKMMYIWNSFSKEDFGKLFQSESWKSPEEMLDYFNNLGDRLYNLKSFK